MTAVMKCLLVSLCFLVLTGCWDKKPIQQQIFVVGMGIDLDDEEMYRITAQMVKPIPPSEGTAIGAESPVWNLSSKGRTVMEANNQMNRISPRRLEWSHLQLIVFSEKAAKNGIQPVMTWFEREADSNSSATVIISEGPAEDLLNVKLELGKIPAESISELIEITKQQNILARRMSMHELNEQMTEMGIDPSIDLVTPRKVQGKVESIQLTGTAIFKDDKLVDKMTIPDNNSIEIMLKEFDTGTFTTGCPGSKNRFLSFLSTDFNNKIRINVRNEKVTVQSKILMEGNISGATCTLDFTDPKARLQAEKHIEDHVKKIVLQGFKQASAKGSDAFGIGREIRRWHPKQWHKIQSNWHSDLKNISMDVQVDVKIIRTGLIQQHPNVK